MKYSNPPYLLSVHKKYLKCDMNVDRVVIEINLTKNPLYFHKAGL